MESIVVNDAIALDLCLVSGEPPIGRSDQSVLVDRITLFSR